MKKKNYSILIITILIFVTSIIWDSIKLPYNQFIQIIGQDYLPNQHHPQNDTLRFLIFILTPLLGYLFYNLNFYQINFSQYFKRLLIIPADLLNKPITKNTIKSDKLDKVTFIFFFLIFLEFLSLNFTSYISEIDMFHEGLWLTASSNAIYTGEFWRSSYIGRGLFGNFYNYFLWEIFNFTSIGLSRYVFLVFTFLNKIILILIARSMIQKIDLFEYEKVLLFVVIVSLSFHLFNYDITASNYFRLFVLLVVSLLILNYFNSFKDFSYSVILIGFLSSFSLFWFIDIGFFTNLIIILFMLFLLINKRYTSLVCLLFSIFLGWLFFLLILPNGEFNYFINNVRNIINSIEYIQGLIYPTPFSENSKNSTMPLLIILIIGILILRLNFKKKDYISYKIRISLLFLFLISCVSFKIALSRSDNTHINAGILISYLSFYFLLILYLYQKLKISDFFKRFKINYNYFTFIILFIFIGTTFFKDENKNFNNIKKHFTSTINLINADDEAFIDDEYRDFIKYYRNLIEKDNCVVVFTNETALPYFLKKPTCSKYFSAYISSPKYLQNKYILDLIDTKPEFIIYSSFFDEEYIYWYGKTNIRLDDVNKYIKKNYSFYEKKNKWVIYKMNKDV